MSGRPRNLPRPASPSPAEAGAEPRLLALLREQPDSGQHWQQLAALYGQSNRPAPAAEAYARAVANGVALTAVAMPYALALGAAGQAAAAVAVARQAQSRRPKDFALTNLLGVLLKRAGQPREAIPFFEAAKALDPRSISPWQNLGNVHEQLGTFRTAAKAFQGGLRLEPRNGELWRLHGRALRAAGDLPGAVGSLERAFALLPRSQDALAEFVGALLDCGEPERALALTDRARQARPGDVEVEVAATRILLRMGRRDDARARLDAVLASHPGERNANLLLAVLIGEGDREAANAVLRRGVAANPRDMRLLGELVNSLGRSRYGDEAAHIEEAYGLACQLVDRHPEAARNEAVPLRTIFQRCLDPERLRRTGSLVELAPGWVAQGQISAIHYELGNVADLEDRVRIVDWHRAWGRRRAAAITPLARPAVATGRPIRVGFMSSDLRHHPVSYFALQLLERHDRDRFEVFCYSFYEGQRDRMQAHIESLVTFRWWPKRGDAEVAAGIAADQLDMLFELGGSTAMNKLEVMAHRPARIGASWLGYPHSSGLEAIDYILTDPYLRPDDPRLLIERPFELPDTWVSLGELGFRDEPIADTLPEERAGHLTFGTMNNPYKYTAACLDAWAAVLRAVPGSRFLFVRPEGRTKAFTENARAAFAARDVDPDRLAFIGIRGQHLQHYNAIDIALDTLPHVGGTTTCETLWMGVPTVSLVGPGFPERLSYSNLSNAGLGELAVRSVDDYVATAAGLAADPARRRLLRYGLRDMIRARPLGQVDRFVAAFYGKVEQVTRA